MTSDSRSHVCQQTARTAFVLAVVAPALFSTACIEAPASGPGFSGSPDVGPVSDLSRPDDTRSADMEANPSDAAAPTDTGAPDDRVPDPVTDTGPDAIETVDQSSSDTAAPSDAGGDVALVADAPDLGADLLPALSGTVILIVSDAAALIPADASLLAYLEGEGLTVVPLSDENSSDAQTIAADAVIMTRSTSSSQVLGNLYGLQKPLLHWEFALQWSDRLGTAVEPSTAPPASGDISASIYVDPNAPASLRCGAQGDVPLYAPGALEVTYANATSLGSGAIAIGTLGPGDPRVAYYAYPAGSTLADGSVAAGARIYLGIGKETWDSLTPNGVELVRCAVVWALGQ